jgi:enoyl-CoA hydratase/carnithine racemase
VNAATERERSASPAPAFGDILYEVREHIATITLNRPEKLNAWTLRMQEELRQAFDIAGNDPEVRVIVVTGAGRGFCAGADLGRLAKVLDGTGTEADVGPFARDESVEASFDQPLSYLLAVPKPVIAAINGPAVGIGLCLTLFCDLRFMSSTAKLATAFPRLGLIAEYGSAWMLPRLIGLMNAFDLLYSGRQVDAEEAGRLGLVRVLPAETFMDEVDAYARELAARCSPRSLAVIKRQLLGGLLKNLAESCVEADREMLAGFESEDFREGVAHFLAKRAPNFVGR